MQHALDHVANDKVCLVWIVACADNRFVEVLGLAKRETGCIHSVSLFLIV